MGENNKKKNHQTFNQNGTTAESGFRKVICGVNISIIVYFMTQTSQMFPKRKPLKHLIVADIDLQPTAQHHNTYSQKKRRLA